MFIFRSSNTRMNRRIILAISVAGVAEPGVQVSHEEPPKLPWKKLPGERVIRERFARMRRHRDGRILGDVASFYLPYVQNAIAVEPAIRIVCLKRPREEVVRSFCSWLDRGSLPPDQSLGLATRAWLASRAELDTHLSSVRYQGSGGRHTPLLGGILRASRRTCPAVPRPYPLVRDRSGLEHRRRSERHALIRRHPSGRPGDGPGSQGPRDPGTERWRRSPCAGSATRVEPSA